VIIIYDFFTIKACDSCLFMFFNKKKSPAFFVWQLLLLPLQAG